MITSLGLSTHPWFGIQGKKNSFKWNKNERDSEGEEGGTERGGERGEGREGGRERGGERGEGGRERERGGEPGVNLL